MKQSIPDRSSPPPSMSELCGQAIGYLERACELPPQELERNVDRAENVVVALRDSLIQRLRSESPGVGPETGRWRAPLDQVNVSLSLITGVAYPSSRIHRNYIEDARQVLMGLQKELQA